MSGVIMIAVGLALVLLALLAVLRGRSGGAGSALN